MKYSDILRTASSNMLRSKLRSFLTIIAIFIGALTLTLTNGIGAGVSTYIDKQLGNIGAEDVLIIQGKSPGPLANEPKPFDEDSNTSNAGGFPMILLSQKDIESITKQPGIKSAEFDLNVAPNYIVGTNSSKFQTNVNTFQDGINIITTAGGSPDNASAQNQILLTPEFVTPLGFASAEAAVGQTITLGIKTPAGVQREVKATISGVQEKSLMSTGGQVINRHLVRELHAIQTENLPENLRNQHPVIVARFDTSLSETELQSLKDNLDAMNYSASTVKDQIGIVKQVIDAIIMVLNFFAAIALIAASFGIVNTLLMAVQERTKEIGLMKAMGMRSKRIFALFSIEAILLGFWGSLLGTLAGVGIGQVINGFASEGFLKDFPGFDLMAFPAKSILTIMLIIMGVAFLASTMPARRASKKDPIEALRYE